MDADSELKLVPIWTLTLKHLSQQSAFVTATDQRSVDQPATIMRQRAWALGKLLAAPER